MSTPVAGSLAVTPLYTVQATDAVVSWDDAGATWRNVAPWGTGGPFLPLTGGTLTGRVTFTGAAPQITLNNPTSNWINWPAVGLGAPQFTTSSPGTRLILWPAVGASSADYAIGMASGVLWFGVPTTGSTFAWYGGTTSLMSLGPVPAAGTLTVAGEIISTNGAGTYGNMRLVGGNYGAILRQDGANFYILLTNSGNQYGNWNALRPFSIDMPSGAVAFGHNTYANAFFYVQSSGDPGASINAAGFSKNRWRFAQASGDDPNAGAIDFRGYDANALSLVGAGGGAGGRKVTIFDNLVVNGTISGGFVTSTGSQASYLFVARDNASVNWQLYAQSNAARLYYSGLGDAMVVDIGGNVKIAGYGIQYGGSYGSLNKIGFGWATYPGFTGNVAVSIDNGGAVYPIANASDERMKFDIAPATYDCLDTVRRLPLHQFRWRDIPAPHGLKDAKAHDDAPLTRIGLVAQRVHEVFREGVVKGDDHDDRLGAVWGIDHNNMIALLVGAVQQLTAQVEALKARA